MNVVGLPTHAYPESSPADGTSSSAGLLPPSAPSIRTTLFILIGTYVTGVILLIVALAWIDWDKRLTVAERDSGRVASLLAERAQRTITAAERILNGMSERISRTDLAEWSRDPIEVALFRSSAFALPGLGALWVFDERGKFVLGSDEAAMPLVPELSERESLIMRQSNPAVVHLGGVAKNRADGKVSWPISRSIFDEQGLFKGTVLASIMIDSFANVYEVADLGARSTLTLVRNDGQILMRYPISENMIGKRLTGEALRGVPLESISSIRTTSPLDNTSRLFAFRRLVGPPAVAIAGVAINDLREGWMDFLILLLGGGFIAIFPVAFFGALALKSAAKEANAAAALAQANGVLEERVKTRTEELQVALRQAHIANAARGRFIAAANRDLRQPMQSVRLFIDLLGIRLADGPHESTINNARLALDQGEAVLVSLREISRLDSGLVRTVFENVRVAEFMADLAERHREACVKNGITLRLHANRQSLITDPVLLATALDQLLANAIKYTERGGVLLAVRTYAERTVIEVWDTGCGIAEADIPAIFEDFVQMRADRTGTLGLGLGLSLVRRITGLLGYSLDARSRPGKGSVFRITIPVQAEHLR